MAKMLKKGVIGEFSGKVGQVIIRRMKSGIYYLVTPGVYTKPRSKLQLESQARFAEATRYARHTRQKRPEVWSIYQRRAKTTRRLTPTNVAVQDFMSPPTIDDVDVSYFKGKAGDPIYIEAQDKNKVVKVSVSIRDGDGNLIEEGEAQMDSKRDWSYRVEEDLAIGKKLRVEVTVTDLVGHEVKEAVEVELEEEAEEPADPMPPQPPTPMGGSGRLRECESLY